MPVSHFTNLRGIIVRAKIQRLDVPSASRSEMHHPRFFLSRFRFDGAAWDGAAAHCSLIISNSNTLEVAVLRASSYARRKPPLSLRMHRSLTSRRLIGRVHVCTRYRGCRGSLESRFPFPAAAEEGLTSPPFAYSPRKSSTFFFARGSSARILREESQTLVATNQAVDSVTGVCFRVA